METTTESTQQATKKGGNTNLITWKGSNKEMFDAAYAEWSATQPKSTGQGDFIMDLMKRASRAEADSDLDKRLDACGIAALVDMHRRRMRADAEMLEQIATMIDDAKGKAEETVKAEINIQQKTITHLTATLEKSNGELETLKAEKAVLLEEKAQDTDQIKTLEKNIESLKVQVATVHEKDQLIAQGQTDLKEARSELDQIKKAKAEDEKRIVQMETSIKQIPALESALIEEQKKAASLKADLEKTTAGLEATKAALTQAQIEAATYKASATERERTITALQDSMKRSTETEAAHTATLEAIKDAISTSAAADQKTKK